MSFFCIFICVSVCVCVCEHSYKLVTLIKLIALSATQQQSAVTFTLNGTLAAARQPALLTTRIVMLCVLFFSS